MTCSTRVAPRPPNSRGQSIAQYPASYIRFCQERSRRTSSRSAREAANARPRRSSGRLRSSHCRTSLRKASSCSPKSKFTALALPHHAAAVDVEGLARDEPRLVGGKEHGGPSDIVRRLLAFHGNDVRHPLLEDLPRRHTLEGGVGLGDVGG